MIDWDVALSRADEAADRPNPLDPPDPDEDEQWNWPPEELIQAEIDLAWALHSGDPEEIDRARRALRLAQEQADRRRN